MTTAPPTTGGSQKTGEWLKTHKQEALLGAGGIVIALALYVRSKNASASSGSNAATQSYANPATVGDTTATDAYSGLENQVLGLQQALLGVATAQQTAATAGPAAAATTPTPSAPSPAPAPTGYASNPAGGFAGSGYAPASASAPAYSYGGDEFSLIPNGAALGSLLGAGGQAWFEPAPGVFQPSGGVALQPGTPQYAKV